jgi:hypothetical protein
VHEYGPFDITIHTEHAHPHSYWNETASRFNQSVDEFYSKSFAFKFKLSDLYIFWNDSKNFLNVSNYNVATFFQTDLQGVTDGLYQYVGENFDLLIGLGEEFCKDSNLNEKPFNYKHTNNWSKLLLSKKILSLPHFVGCAEFAYLGHGNRSYNWSILGVSYSDRKLARDILKRYNISCNDGRDMMHYIEAIRYKLGIERNENSTRIKKSNDKFRSILSLSKASYTCGSEISYPIRKFFEIPASGSLLVCNPCSGFEELGFISMENAIVASPKDLVAINHFIISNQSQTQSIAHKGQQLIFSKHTVMQRSKQLRMGLERVLKKTFHKSKWHKGELVFTDKMEFL